MFSEILVKVNSMTDSAIYSNLSIVREVAFEIGCLEEFVQYVQFIDARIVPILIEMESDFSNTFDFTFGCFTGILESYTQSEKKDPKYKSEWAIVGTFIFTALCYEG